MCFAKFYGCLSLLSYCKSPINIVLDPFIHERNILRSGFTILQFSTSKDSIRFESLALLYTLHTCTSTVLHITPNFFYRLISSQFICTLSFMFTNITYPVVHTCLYKQDLCDKGPCLTTIQHHMLGICVCVSVCDKGGLLPEVKKDLVAQFLCYFKEQMKAISFTFRLSIGVMSLNTPFILQTLMDQTEISS